MSGEEACKSRKRSTMSCERDLVKAVLLLLGMLNVDKDNAGKQTGLSLKYTLPLIVWV
ncbi:MAG: hypothetical protein OHK0052_16440 [Anaerolineales bacterium]